MNKGAHFFGQPVFLYDQYKEVLSSDSRGRKVAAWIKQLQIIDSTTISLFSNLIFKGVGRYPKSGKKKGGFKVHMNIHANKRLKRSWSFSGLATMVRLMLMYYVNCYTFFEEPEKDN